MRAGFPDFRLGSVLATSFTATLTERCGDRVERIPTPQRLVDWLAVSGRVTTGLGRLRELVAVAMEDSRWRGTSRGLTSFLQAATGVSGWSIDERSPGSVAAQSAFHMVVHGPKSVAPHAPMVERIVEMEKPAAVTYELLYDA
jgi:hypothetical protein